MPPSQRKYDAIHAKNLESYAFRVKKAYLEAIREVSKATYQLKPNSNGEFYFRNYNKANIKVNDILKELYSNVYGTTASGITTEWELAVDKNNVLAEYVFGATLDQLPDEYKAKYLSNNDDARKAFIKRKTKGLNLSDRVWNNTRQFKTELELSLELGLGKGKSADELSRSVRRYLNEPDKLFRRVRDENGVLRLSKAGKAYSPGQGVYRSSYKNAQRLTRNENNNSYRESAYQKRSQQEFIVGIEIKTTQGYDRSIDKGGIICGDLAGKYPKSFNFQGWHVNCRCQSYEILKTRDELNEDVEKILAGKEPDTKSKNSIDKIPTELNSYVKNNKDKWKNWKTKPYWSELTE